MDDSRDYVTRGELREVISYSVEETLVKLGIEADDPIEMQRDFQTLRDWRKASISIRSKAMLTVITLFVAGTLGALWIGVKSVFKP